MPYDASGNATISRIRAVTGEKVQAVQVNVPFDDVQAMLSQVLLRSGVAPMLGNLNMNGFLLAGLGDGVSDGDAVTKAQLDAVAADIPAEGVKLDTLQPYASVASAATTDIGAATSQNVTITGTATITSFGTVAAGTVRNLVFAGALTLTHNATSLILPFGANIVTAARTTIRAVSLGSGNWRVTDYQPAAGYSPTLTVGTGLTSTGSLADGAMTIELDIYTGSSASQTSYPIGTYLAVGNAAPSSRNGSDAVYLSTTENARWTGVSGGSQLAGTWRNKGEMANGNFLMMRSA